MQTICNLFIRPKRDMYSTSELGPTYFSLNNIDFRRKDFQLVSQMTTSKPTALVPVIDLIGFCTSRSCF